jgi:hypothetical protein
MGTRLTLNNVSKVSVARLELGGPLGKDAGSRNHCGSRDAAADPEIGNSRLQPFPPRIQDCPVEKNPG